MSYTSKQEKEGCAKGGGYGISLIMTRSRVVYCCPAGTIRDALVGAVETENRCHCSASGGK